MLFSVTEGDGDRTLSTICNRNGAQISGKPTYVGQTLMFWGSRYLSQGISCHLISLHKPEHVGQTSDRGLSGTGTAFSFRWIVQTACPQKTGVALPLCPCHTYLEHWLAAVIHTKEVQPHGGLNQPGPQIPAPTFPAYLLQEKRVPIWSLRKRGTVSFIGPRVYLAWS